jgi:hypothetical protein
MKAQLAASIHCWRRAAWIALPLRAAAQFNAALMAVHGAAIAYVTLFSLAPLLLVLLGVGGLLFDSDSLRVQLLSQLDALVGALAPMRLMRCCAQAWLSATGCGRAYSALGWRCLPPRVRLRHSSSPWCGCISPRKSCCSAPRLRSYTRGVQPPSRVSNGSRRNLIGEPVFLNEASHPDVE